MPVHNSEIADIFDEVADLLEIEGANQFRVRAYRTVARTLSGMPQSVADMVEQGKDLSKLPGIGKDLAGKIGEIVQTGKLPLLEEIHGRVPRSLRELMSIPGLGARRVAALRDKLGIQSAAALRKAAQAHQIRGLPGFGEKTEKLIIEELKRLKGAVTRFKLVVAEDIAKSMVDYLKKAKGIEEVAVAGSLRRRRETVGDLDILAACDDPKALMNHCVKFEEVAKVLAHGETKTSVRLRSGIQVDVRVVPEKSFGAALHYFTGSKAHNIAVRKMGVARKLKINEYGVFRGRKQIAGRTEKEVYAQVKLPYIEPELREDRGELDAARKKKLPRLITLEDIRGDLHCHTVESDGRNTLEEMAEAARERGYEYLAISDHSKRVAMARGLDEKRLAAQIKQIDRLNGKLKGIRLLKAIEVDILEDGSLDLSDDILKELDLAICSIHYKLNLPANKQTERLIRAMDNPHCLILGHPTGRLINARPSMELDIEKIMEAALERGVALEINSQPDRLDLNDVHCKMARDMGLKLAVSTDAHRVTDLDYIRFGIGQARRGWIAADDVLNTRSWSALRKQLRKR